jgi:hypothetical protein
MAARIYRENGRIDVLPASGINRFAVANLAARTGP